MSDNAEYMAKIAELVRESTFWLKGPVVLVMPHGMEIIAIAHNCHPAVAMAMLGEVVNRDPPTIVTIEPVEGEGDSDEEEATT